MDAGSEAQLSLLASCKSVNGISSHVQLKSILIWFSLHLSFDLLLFFVVVVVAWPTMPPRYPLLDGANLGSEEDQELGCPSGSAP